MTVQSTTARADYQGNNVTTLFTVPFYFLDNSHVKVTRTDNSTVPPTTALLVLGSDYVVTGAGVQIGGQVQTTVAPTASQVLTILRSVPFTQLIHYVPNDPFPAATHEQALDQLTMEVQELNEVTTHALQFPSYEPVPATLPAASIRANQLLGFGPTGLVQLSPITASVGAGDMRVEEWADGIGYTSGTSTSVTLSRTYGTKANLGPVVMQGIVQDPNSYSLNGTILTFNAVIPAGIASIWCLGGTTLSQFITPDQSVTDAKVAPGSKLFNRINGTVDVNDFPGVDKTGGADSTAGMALAHATGKLVYYPAGTYKFSTISFAAGGIVGDGQSMTILLSSDLTSADLITVTGTGGQSPAMFRDFTIQASLSKTAGAGLRFSASSGQLTYPNITNVQLLNLPTGIFFSNSSQFVIDQCNFVNYSAQAIHIENSNVSDSGDSSISNCFLNTSVVTGSTYGIWHRSGGGLKISNVKILGGNSGYVMGWTGGLGAADLSIGNCSFESPIAAGFGIFLGRDSGSGGIGSVMIANNELGWATCIGTDASGFLTLISINGNVLNTQGTTPTFFGISLNNVSNISIGPNVINAQNAGSPFGIGITASCSNGKIAPQVYTGMPAASCMSNASASVYVAGTQQSGAASITASTAYGALFTGSVAVTFPQAYLVAPKVYCFPSGTGGGQVACFPASISTTGFTMVGVAATSGGAMANNTWIAEGLI